MAIQILPAQLANQIAAGEVVERPASVVKELVENSLDAGANNIIIEIERGGCKRIKITDNGQGVAKDELILALSRHATSKISTLDDLESIASLGFRGEALASISSVSRLSFTSKPPAQDTAWQAMAEGRDMAVKILPAAHPDGTTVDVQDLFFNTPARRKFLRTEKTEFAHIDEVIKRIALAKFNVSFSLIHNGKRIRHYRAINEPSQYQKRVAAVCGNAFIANSEFVDVEHGGMHLTGWIAQPQFCRSQNDLCYSYVNDRMMRDKLINHAIRQAYATELTEHQYPAFVLYLDLDHREVDVNVHPAKHEVRFHQARYVHDFILTVASQALANQTTTTDEVYVGEPVSESVEPSYMRPLQPTQAAPYQAKPASPSVAPNRTRAENYYQLLTPASTDIASQENWKLLTVVQSCYALVEYEAVLYFVNIRQFDLSTKLKTMADKQSAELVSQPLLLPVMLNLSRQQQHALTAFQTQLEWAGFVFNLQENRCQLRACPAALRSKDVSHYFCLLLDKLTANEPSRQVDFTEQLAKILLLETYDQASAGRVFNLFVQHCGRELFIEALLKSQQVDLTCYINNDESD